MWWWWCGRCIDADVCKENRSSATEPSTTHNCWPSRAQKKIGASQTPDESPKNAAKSRIKTIRRTIAINHLITPVKLWRSASAPRQDGDTLSMNCSCESPSSSEPPNHGDLPLWSSDQKIQGDVLLRHDDLVEKQLRNLHSFCTSGELPVRHDRDGENLVSELHLRNLHNQANNGNLPLRHDRDEDLSQRQRSSLHVQPRHLTCTTTGTSTTLSKNACRNSNFSALSGPPRYPYLWRWAPRSAPRR